MSDGQRVSHAQAVNHGHIVPAAFKPHPLLRGAHAQTIVPALWRPTPQLPLEIERWELPDGDFVDLGWFVRPQPGQPIAVLVHGLTGGFDSKYLRGTARQLMARGWAGVILQLRGSGEQPNRLAHAYHQGDTGDVHALLARLRQDYPQQFIGLAGWSLGGNVVLKAAGEAGTNLQADAVAAASVPFRLRECAQRMGQGVSRIYQKRLMDDLKLTAQRKAAACGLPAAVDLPATLAARNWFEFDDAWTAPLNGFDSALDYYQRCASGQFLGHIRVNTLIVHSNDDPFMDARIVPSASDLAPCVRMELSTRGGHVGFVAATVWGGFDFWLERRLADWLNQQAAQNAPVSPPTF